MSNNVITWTKYAIADELDDYIKLGWRVSSYYGQRGPHGTYVIAWTGEGEPVFPESYRRRG